MEDRSRKDKLKNRPRLLARPTVHQHRPSWHAVDRELGGSPATQTPFRRKIYASGTYPEATLFVKVRSNTRNVAHRGYFFAAAAAHSFSRSGYHSIKSFDQTFHLEKRWKLVREMGSGAYGVVMSVRHPHSLFFWPFVSVIDTFFFFLILLLFVAYCNCLVVHIVQLRCGRDLGRDGGDQDGHACIRKDDARETRVARAHSPSTL